MNIFLALEDVSFYKSEYASFEHLNWTIRKNQHWAIVGPVGSGKSLLAEAILGRIHLTNGNINYNFIPYTDSGYQDISNNIAYISFSENSNTFSYSKHYYQQRFNISQSEDSITVEEYLGTTHIAEEISKMFKLEELMPRQFIKLSNGQTRKVRIAKALANHPSLLILDDPFIGLDIESRNYLEGIINKLASSGTMIILITNRHYLPACITNVLEIGNFKIKNEWLKNEFEEKHSSNYESEEHDKIRRLLELTAPQATDFKIAAQFNNVNISYGEKKILIDINWTVKKGEKWALLGHNGAGKSTLLSLITADNPQAYSQDIILFDRKRGTGESIWEIKKKIGFISPELHLYFRSDMNCVDVAGTGFLDTLYLNRDLTQTEHQLLNALFDYFHIEALKETTFLRISTGQQRLILFIRAIVKNPALFILDEPFQGMDEATVSKCKVLLNLYCNKTKTLIFVSHIQEELPLFVDQMFQLKEGIGNSYKL